MKDGALIIWLLSGLPLLGAVSSLLFWSNPARLQLSSVVWSVVSLGSIAAFSSQLAIPSEGLLPLYLPPADRDDLLVGAATSCRPTARVDHDLGLSRTGSRVR